MVDLKVYKLDSPSELQEIDFGINDFQNKYSKTPATKQNPYVVFGSLSVSAILELLTQVELYEKKSLVIALESQPFSFPQLSIITPLLLKFPALANGTNVRLSQLTLNNDLEEDISKFSKVSNRAKNGFDVIYVAAECADLFHLTLRFTRPKLLIAMVNPTIPPPFVSISEFLQQKHSNTICSADSQVSLSHLALIADRFGYQLLQLNVWNAFFIQKENSFLFGDIPFDLLSIWKTGFALSQPFRSFISDCTDKHCAKYRVPSEFNSIMSLGTEQLNMNRVLEILPKIQSANHVKYFIIPPIDHPYKNQKTKTGKFFVYLTQDKVPVSQDFRAMASVNSDVIHLSWSKPQNNTIFFPSSTWTTGRNFLYKLASGAASNEDLKHLNDVANSNIVNGEVANDPYYAWFYHEIMTKQKFQQQQFSLSNYLYFLFLDGDADVRAKTILNPWRIWEKSLLLSEPAMNGPLNMFGAEKKIGDFQHYPISSYFQQVSGVYNLDAAAMTVHREAAPRLLPWNSTYDAESWWYSQLFLLHRAHVMFPWSTNFAHSVGVRNSKHDSNYPKKGEWERLTHEEFAPQLPNELKKCVRWGGGQATVPPTQNEKRPNQRYDGVSYWNVVSCD